MATEVTGRLRELQTTNEAGERRREAMLREIGYSLEDWVVMVRKEKAVYHTLNKLSMDVTSKVLIAEAWVPCYAKQQVQDTLARTGLASHTQLSAVMHTLSSTDLPPTHFRTTKFTSCFQTIVEAYGIARYREVSRVDHNTWSCTGQSQFTFQQALDHFCSFPWWPSTQPVRPYLLAWGVNMLGSTHYSMYSCH
jgi:hypothetical protein